MKRKFEDLDKLCCVCETKLEENTKPIQEWKDYESRLYCPKCKQWMTGSIVRLNNLDKIVNPAQLDETGQMRVIKSNYPQHEMLGKEFVTKIAFYLKWSKERTKIVSELVANHLNENCPLRVYDNLSKRK